MQRCKHWFQSNLVRPLRYMSFSEALVCIFCGILGGLFPVPLCTCAVTTALSYVARLNAAQTVVAIAVNLLVTPICIMLIPTFAQLFAVILGTDSSSFTAAFLAEASKNGVIPLLFAATSMLLHAVFGWLTASCILVLVLVVCVRVVANQRLVL